MKGVFAGTWHLIRLILRRDRIKLPVWIVAIGGMMLFMPRSVADIYATEAERIGYATMSAASAVARLFNGPIDGPDLGSVVIAETFTFMLLFVALMNTLLVVRHTRQNEETGRLELVRAAAVGKGAMLLAVLLVALVANGCISVLTVAGYQMVGLESEGSILAGIAMGLVGLLFAAMAAIAVQVTQSARAANGLAAMAIGIAFLVRAIGDMFGTVQPGSRSVESGWLTWFSPMGWARLTEPFTGGHWWLIGLMIGVTVVLAGIAMILAAHRDIGAGLLAPRLGRRGASVALGTVFGLAWRLQRGLFLGWALGLGFLAVSFGAVAHEVAGFTNGNPEMAAIVEQLGGSESIVESYLAFSISLLAMAVAGYCVQALLRLRMEEASGLLEPILATGTHRTVWMASHVAVVMGAAAVLIGGCGAALGLGHGIATDDIAKQVMDLTGAAFSQLPAIIVFGGLVALLFGGLPRFAIALSWSSLAVSLAIAQFGGLLKLPEWTEKLSPFTQLPLMPGNAFEWAPVIGVSMVAVVFLVGGFLAFRRRDSVSA